MRSSAERQNLRGMRSLFRFKRWGRFCHVVYPTGKAGGHQILCCQGFAVNDYSFTLDALALKPPAFATLGFILFSKWKKSVNNNVTEKML
jgi:hypothetical protein